MSLLLFYASLFSIPFQLGYHFWPPFSYVSGIRIDYLSPTIYLSDLVIGGLFIVSISQQKKDITVALVKNKYWIVYFSAWVIGGIMVSQNPYAGWYSFFKVIEMAYFSWYVARSILKPVFMVAVLGSATIVQVSIATAQFIKQGSIGGPLYFLGERTFSSETPGIANASLMGNLVLRPYGTFPHPNVLGGYLLLVLCILFLFLPYINKQSMRIFAYVTIIFLTLGIALSMSRTIWVLFVGIGLWFLYRHMGNKKHHFVGLVILPLMYLFRLMFVARLHVSFFDEAIQERLALGRAALLMYKSSPFFGVGLSNFLPHLPHYISPKSIFFIQPVHNIFLLLASQLGIFGFSFVLFCIYKTLAQIAQAKKHKNILCMMAISLGVIGLFDHYLLTLQQGQLLLAFCIGLFWNKRFHSSSKDFDTIQ